VLILWPKLNPLRILLSWDEAISNEPQGNALLFLSRCGTRMEASEAEPYSVLNTTRPYIMYSVTAWKLSEHSDCLFPRSVSQITQRSTPTFDLFQSLHDGNTVLEFVVTALCRKK
jgi:hypothetical protein